MFDVGFWEILLIFILALVVIGPERLPGAARKAGYFVGKARRYIEGVRSEVESELDVTEFKRILHNQDVQINELQKQLKTGVENVKADMPENISASELLTDTPSHSLHDEQIPDSKNLSSEESGSDESQSSLTAKEDKS
ncbi:MAG: twin-arginine translocase subunit TatB [Gammaproteobacteria bacterium]|nr:twin-arginine translocase subunit TatB [Gammaproteobacteria bacterium]